MKPRFQSILFPALAAGFSISITSVHAAVGLSNGSFETTGTLYNAALGGLLEASDWTNLSPTTNFQASSAQAVNPPNAEFTSLAGTATGLRYLRLVADGTNVGVLAQSLGTMTAGETYTITADVFGGPGAVATYGATISLVNEVSATPSTTYASQTVSGVTNAVFTAGAFYFTYTATASDDGDPLVLLLRAPAVAGGQASRGGLDNIQLTAVPAPSTNQWAVNGNGNWNTSANWSPSTVPNAQSAGATLDSFGGTITGPVIATLDVPVTLGTLQFDHAFAYTVAGGNALTLDNGGSGAAVTVLSGAHTISAPVTMAESLTATVAFSSSLDLAGSLSGGFPLLKIAAGNLILSGNLSGFTGLTTINSGTVTLPRTGDYSLTHQFAGAGRLAITGGGQVTLAPTSPNSHGGTDVSNGGTLVVDSAGDLGAGGVGFYNGTLAVGADVTAGTAGWLAGAGGGTVNVASGFTLQGGGLTGTGTMNKTGDGTWRITPGGTGATIGLVTVSGGTLDLARNDAFGNNLSGTQALTIQSGGLVTNGAAVNSGYNAVQTLALDGGELRVTGTARAVADGDLFKFEAYGIRSTVTVTGTAPSSITNPGAVTNAGINIGGVTNLGGGVGSDLTFNVADVTGSSAADLTVSAVLKNNCTAAGLVLTNGLVKTGAGTLVLSAANRYTGTTTVSGGTLAVDGDSIADSGKLTIDGGLVDLTGAETVNTLFFGTTQQGAGTYSSSGAGGTIASANFTGTGTLIVTTGPAPTSGYAAWQTANTTSQAANLDHDNDGVSNGVEHFLFGTDDSTGNSNPLPGVDVGPLSVTWTKAATYTGTYGTDFVVETSATLSNPWTPAVVGIGAGFVEITGNNVKYTFPVGTKNFARLKVTVAP